MSVEPESQSKTKNGEPAAKKMKTSPGSDGDAGSGDGRFVGFEVDRVLSDNSQNKLMTVAGKFAGSEAEAVVIVEKTPLTVETVRKMLTADTRTELTLQNDIYGTFQCYPPPASNSLKTTVIYPATTRHIQKYTKQDVHLVEETPDDYSNITLPFIEEENFSIQWVYNILEKKQEADRIVFEDPDPENGFIMVPDMKWDGRQVDDLYLVAIVHRHGIRSLRDLNASHLPLLTGIQDNGIKAIKDKYNIKKSKLRIYFHYQPSYYHLHVHFTHLHYDAPGSGVLKAHLLSDVIANIKMTRDHYQKASLTFVMKENDKLCQKYRELGKI